MNEYVFMGIVGVMCFFTCAMNAPFSDKFWFSILVAVVGLAAIPLSFAFPVSTFGFAFAVAWQLLVVLIGSRMELGKYQTILWLYPLVMSAIIVQWLFWKQGETVFDKTYLNISIGCNVAQVLLLLVFSDYGRTAFNKLRSLFWRNNAVDAPLGAKNSGQ